MSQNDYESNVLKQYFGWTIDEYKAVLADRLLEKKVSFAIDTTAKDKINKVKQRLDNGDDFATVAQEMSDDEARNKKDVITGRVTKMIEQDLADDPYAQEYFSNLLKKAIELAPDDAVLARWMAEAQAR